jgi:hypothetical protein
MEKTNYFTPSQSYCCMQNRFTLFTKIPANKHCSIQEPKQISTKILPSILHTSLVMDSRMGSEITNTILSKSLNDLEVKKFERYKDASDVTKKRAILANTKNRESVKPAKEIPSKYVDQRLRKVRNRGYTVPKKVQNKPNSC